VGVNQAKNGLLSAFSGGAAQFVLFAQSMPYLPANGFCKEVEFL
jgi:hypothetical protein